MSLLTLAPKRLVEAEAVKQPEYILSLILIALGVIIILFALVPGHPLLKAVAIAYIVLP